MSESRAIKRPRSDIQPDLPPPVDDESLPPPPVTPPGSAVSKKALESTPIVNKISGTESFIQKAPCAQERNIKLGQETQGRWVGGMDARVFLDRFLPSVNSNTPRPTLNKSALETVANLTKEPQMYGPFIDAMSPYAPHMELVDVHARVDSRCDGIAVDVAAYRLNNDGQCEIVKCDFSEMEVAVELKPTEQLDPFVDWDSPPLATVESPYPFENNARSEHNEIRGQIAAYLSALAGAQFRLHSFSVFVAGQWARLLRWDRNGIIVSKRFLYAEDDSLVEFFWRYSHAPPYGASGLNRGYDPTVTIYSSPAQTSKETAARLHMANVNNKAHREFRVLLIPDRDSKKEYPFLVSFPPRYTRQSPFGRATRACLAFDLKKDQMVFIKDYWRPVGNHLDKEGDTYKVLENAKVPYLAPFGRGNDIRNHVTYTETTQAEPWAYTSAGMVPLHQYRLSLDEVGRPLNEFKSSHELVTAIADAMEAHEVAYHDAKILHRDISGGNILISQTGRGILIDWDLCLNLNNPKGEARRPNRTGTWQFLSVFLLNNPGRIQGIVDDRESALYVLLWHLMAYTRHNFLDRLPEELRLFDEVSETGRGGKEKELFLYAGHEKWVFEGRPLLSKLISELCDSFMTRYLPPSKQILVGDNMRHTKRFWLVNTMRKYLEPRSAWPTDGAARNIPVRDTNTETKRQYAKRQSAADSRQTGSSSLKRSLPA